LLGMVRNNLFMNASVNRKTNSISFVSRDEANIKALFVTATYVCCHGYLWPRHSR
jgi:hypothetical protein